MKKFAIKSLGCKQNQLEGQIIQNELLKLGYEISSLEEADIYILNSCTVTSHSDSQVNYLLNHAKKTNPKIKTVLAGCVAQTYKQHENFDYSNIDLVLGNSEKIYIEEYIEKTGFFVDDIFSKQEFDGKFLLNPDTTRVSIKIQDGCNNRCAYCIIPYARGNSRSNNIEDIIEYRNMLRVYVHARCMNMMYRKVRLFYEGVGESNVFGQLRNNFESLLQFAEELKSSLVEVDKKEEWDREYNKLVPIDFYRRNIEDITPEQAFHMVLFQFFAKNEDWMIENKMLVDKSVKIYTSWSVNLDKFMAQLMLFIVA